MQVMSGGGRMSEIMMGGSSKTRETRGGVQRIHIFWRRRSNTVIEGYWVNEG